MHLLTDSCRNWLTRLLLLSQQQFMLILDPPDVRVEHPDHGGEGGDETVAAACVGHRCQQSFREVFQLDYSVLQGRQVFPNAVWPHA